MNQRSSSAAATATREVTPTPEQAAVIDHRKGPMIVVSGAGSGKTTVLSLRVCAMLDEGYSPAGMLILTFGRKAATEIVNRLSPRLGAAQVSGMVYTYHGFGWKFLRRFPAVCERQLGVSVLDVLDSRRVFAEAATTTEVVADIDERGQATKMLRMLQGHWSLLRNDSVCSPHELAERYRLRLKDNSDLPGYKVDRAVRTVLEYESLMRGRNLVDFDHLLTLPARAVANNSQAREWLQRRYPYLMVDESQDTNLAQYELVRHLGGHGNVVMVGDDDQVLFTWRGARAENLRRFIRDFDPKQVFLTQNWRSTRAIVSASDALIQNNTDRIKKKPFSTGDQGSVPVVRRFLTGNDMARGLAAALRSAIAQGVSPDSVAVLYRTNRMAKLLEGDLKRAGVPYKLVGSHSLFDTHEIRAVMGAVRLRGNHLDPNAYDRLAKFLPGVGSTLVESIAEWSATQDENPWIKDEAPRTTGMATRLASAITGLHKKMAALTAYGPSRLGQWALAEDGLSVPTAVAGSKAMLGNLERIKANLMLLDQVNEQAVAAMYELVERNKLERADPWAAITDTMLSDAVPETPSQNHSGPVVTLSTIHRAKGLEWDTVYVAGATEGLMPLANAVADEDEFSGGVEEERRLAFVALSRARKRCIWLHAEELFIPGMQFPMMGEPSSFLTEMRLTIPDPAKPGGLEGLSIFMNRNTTEDAPSP